MKILKLWTVPGTTMEPLADYDEMCAFADRVGYSRALVVEADVKVMEDGDRISIELCVNFCQSEDGIIESDKGEWVEFSGVWRQDSGKIGHMVSDKGQFIQSLRADMHDAFPYRNIRLLEALVISKAQAKELLAVSPFTSEKGGFVLERSIPWRGLFAWGGVEGPCVFGAYLPSGDGLVEVHLGWENLSFPDAMPANGYCFLVEASEVRNWLTAASAAKRELLRIADGDDE